MKNAAAIAILPAAASLAAEVNGNGSGLSTFASCLRDTEFMAIHPRSGLIWATEPGRIGLALFPEAWPPRVILKRPRI